MVNQYPHTLVVTVTTPTQNISTGLFTNATTAVSLTCRAEPNGSGDKVMGADGVMVDYSFICYSAYTGNIYAGTPVLLNGAIYSTVKRFNKGQFNSRIWL